MWNFVADYAPDALAFFGGLLVVWCTLRDWPLERSRNEQSLSTLRRLALAIAVGGTMSIVGAFWGSQQNVQFQKQLTEKSNEIAELNRKTADYLAGGNTFCYVAPDFENTTEAKELLFHYYQSGDSPTWDVKLFVTDAYEYERLFPKFKVHGLIPKGELTKEK